MKSSLLATIFLAACFLLPTTKKAIAGKISIYVTNCVVTGSKGQRTIKALIYDGKDGARLITRTQKKISYGETKRLRCKPQGKSRCWLRAKPNGKTNKSYRTKAIGKNKYVKVTNGSSKLSFEVSTSKPSCD